MEEQVAIASFLERETCKYDALTAEAQRAIDLLQERRTALISAAVTGKIDVRGEIPVQKPFSKGFARQLLAAEILSRGHSQPTMGRVKLQKLIFLCEHVAQIHEVSGTYSREAAGPFDSSVMFGIATGLRKAKWFAERRDGGRSVYQPLEKAGEHVKYLSRWDDKLPAIHRVLQLLEKADTQQCEIVATLYAAWNDLLIERRSPTDKEIINEASNPERWHESKAQIPAGKWPAALSWMRGKGIVPTGFGKHTKHS